MEDFSGLDDMQDPPVGSGIDFSRLTPRQTQVLLYLARGLTNKEIGQVLNCAPGTVKNHIASILSRLDVSNRTEAASEWMRSNTR